MATTLRNHTVFRYLLIYSTCKDCQLLCSLVDGLCVPSLDTMQDWAVQPNHRGPHCGRSQPCMSQPRSSSTVQSFSPSHDGSLRPSKKIDWWVRTMGCWWWLITTVPWQGAVHKICHTHLRHQHNAACVYRHNQVMVQTYRLMAHCGRSQPQQ